MQKLSRSLIAVSALALLAACGDDVSITPPPEPAPATIARVDVVPAQLTIDVDQKVILTSVVTVNPGSGAPATTVTWSSADATIASVSATGEVTGVAPGTTTIRATSTVDASKVGAAAITVRESAPATVSIKSVTAGLTTAPVNFNNVRGQIDVTLNVDPGDQSVSSVDVLIDGEVACSQGFSGLVAVEDIAEALAEIVCSIATHEFDPVTGEVTYFNGVHQLSARANLAGGTQVATPSVALTFNNPSGFIVSVENTGTNGAAPSSAVNPTTGIGYTQGDHEVTLVGVNYAAGGLAFSTVGVNLFGVNQVLTPAAGTQTFTATFDATQDWDGVDPNIGGYLSPGPEAPTILSSTLSNGQAGVSGGAAFLNSVANAPGLGLDPLPAIRVDNSGPGITTTNLIAQTAPTGTQVMPLWVNSSFTFVPSAVFASGEDLGVNAVTRVFYAIDDVLPGGADECDFTGMEVVTTGADLDATTVSTVYSIRVADTDALGNMTCWDLTDTDAVNTTGTIGADFVAPTIVSVTGPADLSGTNVAPGNFVLSVTDNASGFGPNPVFANITRVNASGSTSCVVAPSGSCSGGFVGTLPITFDATNGTNVEGYYTIANWNVADQALNMTAIADRTYLLDATAPTFAGGISLQPLYTGNATAAFNTAVADNIDLNAVFGVLTYPTASFQYPDQSVGSYGVPLEKSANVAFNVANFMRCVNVPGDFATTTNKANAVTLTVTDFGGNSTTNAPFAIPPANVENCGAVGATPINTFGPTTVAYETGKTQVDIDGASLAAASGTTATLSAVADVPLNTAVDPFARVDFYWFDGTNFRFIGSSTGVLAQTPTVRTYTYTLVWDPAAPVTAAVTNVVAIGVDAQGDAVATVAGAIVLVP
jgi:hypothetical protein